MKGQKIILPMLSNRELQFWTTVDFEIEYFLNEETGGVLTDSYCGFPWLAPNLAISTQT